MPPLFVHPSDPVTIGASDYGVLLSSTAEIARLADAADRLLPRDDTTLHPAFFLASISRGWKPQVVAVYRSNELVGVLYTKERIIKGVATGVVYADGSLGGILLADPSHHAHTLQVAMDVLLASSRIRGVRLRIARSSGDLAGIRQIIASNRVDARYSRIAKHHGSLIWKYHALLPLPDSYDGFLQRLGSSTRHNFRYYRRRFEAAGHHFAPHLSIDELRSATQRLYPGSKFGDGPRVNVAESVDMVAAARRPLAMGLQHRGGDWVSVLGGWYTSSGAVLLFQCNNDRMFPTDSLSVVLRAFLIETLIDHGYRDLVIWSDTGPPLSRYVTHVPTVGVYLDVPTPPWRIARWLLSTVGPRLPRRLAAAAQWVAPTAIAHVNPIAE